MKDVTYTALDGPTRELIDCAAAAMEGAYSPYSHFKVGTALRSLDGKIITGTNFENASYGLCICAERTALTTANNQGIRQFQAAAIIARGETFELQNICAPCGACRQLLFEASQLSEQDMKLYMCNSKKTKIVEATINELLPLAFGPNELGIDVSHWKECPNCQMQ